MPQPNARVTLVTPVSSSTHPLSLTVAVDYDYPNPLPLPAYLLVRCKDSPTAAAVYQFLIDDYTNGVTPQTEVVNHTTAATDVEVEARIVATQSWDGNLLCSSCADDITLTANNDAPIDRAGQFLLHPHPHQSRVVLEHVLQVVGAFGPAGGDAVPPPHVPAGVGGGVEGGVVFRDERVIDRLRSGEVGDDDVVAEGGHAVQVPVGGRVPRPAGRVRPRDDRRRGAVFQSLHAQPPPAANGPRGEPVGEQVT